jgi:hypothetical protein
MKKEELFRTALISDPLGGFMIKGLKLQAWLCESCNTVGVA